MNKSINWHNSDESKLPLLRREKKIQQFRSPPLPEPHRLEVDVSERQSRVPGHNQSRLNCHVGFIGAGGINSWTMSGMLRCGITECTVIDFDQVARTNLTRQYYFAEDLGKLKAPSLAKNLRKHSTAEAFITAVSARFEDVVNDADLKPFDLLIVGVDNNRARLAAAKYARVKQIPAVFAALSLDGMRVHSFLQGPNTDDACWHCALPDTNPLEGDACAAAIISSCFLAASFLVFLGQRALMGWPEGVQPYNWRKADLFGGTPGCTGFVKRRPNCPTCGYEG